MKVKMRVLLLGICLCLTSVTAIAAEDTKTGANGVLSTDSSMEENITQESAEGFMKRALEIEDKILEEEGIDADTMARAQSGSSTVADALGMDGIQYIDWLSSHEQDSYYLTTPYVGDDWRSPNGDPAFNGSPGMNCTGFVWHALMFPTHLSGGNTSIIPGITGWVNFYRNYDISREYFPSKEDMLGSGYLEKGDIIWVFIDSEFSYNSDHHVGIYWGSGSDDILWESCAGSANTNQFGTIAPTFSNNIYVAIKSGGIQLQGFRDVPGNAWFYRYVMDVFEKGLMTGKTERIFAPTEDLTRGQFVTVLYRISGQPNTEFISKFPDVDNGIFYSIPVTWASESDVITGYGNGLFGPQDSITREQLATMLMRFSESNNGNVSNRTDLSAFPDSSAVSDFAEDAMQWAVAEGIISGDQGMLNPQGKVSRAVCATMISRFSSQ